MAIGWLTVLQMVPWSDVIKNAPKVAEGAKKLWNTVGKKSPAPPAPAGTVTATPLSPEAQALADLQTRLGALEVATQELHEQMLASSELIKSLAEQNSGLIRRVEVQRLRLLALAGMTVAAIAALVLALLRLA